MKLSKRYNSPKVCIFIAVFLNLAIILCAKYNYSQEKIQTYGQTRPKSPATKHKVLKHQAKSNLESPQNLKATAKLQVTPNTYNKKGYTPQRIPQTKAADSQCHVSF